MTIELGAALGIVGAIIGWLGVIDHRQSKITMDLEKRIDDKQAINHVVQQELKEGLIRIEKKVDTIIEIQLTKALNRDHNHD